MIKKNLNDSIKALKISLKLHDNKDLSEDEIRDHIKDKEYYAIYNGDELVGAMYFNGNDFHIGMIKKGRGLFDLKKILSNRHARAVIENTNTRTIKLAKLLGFKGQYQNNKYTYMVK